MHDQATQWWSGVSLRTKITGVTVLLLTIGLLVAGVGTMTVLRGYLLDEVDRKISEAALNFGSIPPMGETLCERSAGPGSLFVAVVDEDGSLVCRNRSADAAQPTLGGLTLPAVTSQAFSGVDSVTGTKQFQIGLNCSSGAVVRITLDTGTPVINKTGVIAPSSGGAGGVGVRLLDSSGVTPVQFGVAKEIGPTPDGALLVNYFAQYYQTGSTVSAGQLSATATFTLSYQ